MTWMTFRDLEAEKYAAWDAAHFAKNAQIVANLEGRPAELIPALSTHPAEILAHPCLELWELAEPAVVLELRYQARYRIVMKRMGWPLFQFPLRSMRLAACDAVREVLPLFSKWKPRVMPPEGAALLHPTYAIEVALANCERKAVPRELSWAVRFARSFQERGAGKTATREEQKLVTQGEDLARLCAGCCQPNRPELWLTIERAAKAKTTNRLAVVAFLERHADRIEALSPKKKTSTPARQVPSRRQMEEF